MDFLIQCVSFVVFSGFVALAVRLAGRLFARTSIQWLLCFKSAAIIVLSLFILQFLGLIGATAATGFLLGLLLAFAAHAGVGAVHLGPRVLAPSGQSLGRLRGALVGVGAGFLWMGASAILLLALAMLGLVRG